jgi:hypothetical protein
MHYRELGNNRARSSTRRVRSESLIYRTDFGAGVFGLRVTF